MQEPNSYKVILEMTPQKSKSTTVLYTIWKDSRESWSPVERTTKGEKLTLASGFSMETVKMYGGGLRERLRRGRGMATARNNISGDPR
jgi:hypothetical protein